MQIVNTSGLLLAVATAIVTMASGSNGWQPSAVIDSLQQLKNSVNASNTPLQNLQNQLNDGSLGSKTKLDEALVKQWGGVKPKMRATQNCSVCNAPSPCKSRCCKPACAAKATVNSCESPSPSPCQMKVKTACGTDVMTVSDIQTLPVVKGNYVDMVNSGNSRIYKVKSGSSFDPASNLFQSSSSTTTSWTDDSALTAPQVVDTSSDEEWEYYYEYINV